MWHLWGRALDYSLEVSGDLSEQQAEEAYRAVVNLLGGAQAFEQEIPGFRVSAVSRADGISTITMEDRQGREITAEGSTFGSMLESLQQL